jgi:phage terminase large subunit-like protein
MFLGGRGAGKTRAMAEWINEKALSDRVKILIVSPSFSEARQTIIEGESGVIRAAPPGSEPMFQASKRMLQWPNGSTAYVITEISDIDVLRGREFHYAAGDDVQHWSDYLFNEVNLATRLGDQPQVALSATPKKGSKVIKTMLKFNKSNPIQYRVTRGSLDDNLVNLPPQFVAAMRLRYLGTLLEKPELHGIPD